MRVHVVDGTFELFRAFFGAPPAHNAAGVEVGATRGVMRTLLALVREERATHIGVAFDHVIESFRNGLLPGYKTGEGLDERLVRQFPLVERAAEALGMVVWPMVEFEADDALATAAARWADACEQVVICSPDKDLAQCVRGTRVITVDRMRKTQLDEEGVRDKFGISPRSIPDWLALVGDTADGIPGVPRWGARSAATVLARYERLEDIPERADQWDVTVRGAASLATELAAHREAALLYRRVATLRTDVPLPEDLAALEWRGVNRPLLHALCEELDYSSFLDRVPA